MKMMFAMRYLTEMFFFPPIGSATDRAAEETAAPVHREESRKEDARQLETEGAKSTCWWEIENIDGRNEAHPAYMLPLILPDRGCQQSNAK